MRFAITLLPFILPVMASDHKQCDCQINDGNGWKYDWQLTFNVCTNNYEKTAEYDNGAGRCIANPHVRLDGDRFYNNCKLLAKTGWYPVVNGAVDTTKPKIYAKQGGSGCYN
ncbi:hypothetical protein FPCIR_12827 [Fusarium pseudocircinatum]|uniref:Uncharacterized protein n=1 Tax=Fusarium pseudocircinatum TaxID=56676 RepID=A0A8H5NU76_9HYPO|nr:hypothetical protein FPCIR_12827 [Fusarium pseudocircinatum]